MSNNRIQTFIDAKQTIKSGNIARKRLEALFDNGDFTEIDTFVQSAGVITAFGTVAGAPVYAFVQDFEEEYGAVGRLHGQKIEKIYDLALKMGAPVIGIYDSFGAKLSEGLDALGAYGKLLCASNRLSGVVPQISVVLGVCAGAAAVMATAADFVVMSEKAEFFMTSSFTAKANGETVPEVGSAENAQKEGIANLIGKDDLDTIEKARKLVSLLPSNNLADLPLFDFSAPDSAALENMIDTPSATDTKAILRAVFDQDSMLELTETFAENAVTAFATLSGFCCGVVATTGEYLNAQASAKIARFVSVCDAYHIPVITFVNTPGFAKSAAAELAGSIRDIAKLTQVYAEATTPKISVVIGQAYATAYIALAGRANNADVVMGWPTACVAALEPETAVTLLHAQEITAQNSRQQVEQAYKENDANILRAAELGYVDMIIEPKDTRNSLISTLDMLSSKRITKLPKKHANIPF